MIYVVARRPFSVRGCMPVYIFAFVVVKLSVCTPCDRPTCNSLRPTECFF